MRIGINGNRLVATGRVDTIVEHAVGVAGDGLDSYWLAQHPAGALDALTTLAVAGGRLPQTELATGVVPIWGSHPAALASRAVSAAQSIPGGLTVGIGLSHLAMVSQHLGLTFDRSTRRMREYLEILVPLVSDGEVDYHGEFYSCTTKFPATVVAPTVLVAAMGEQMLTLAGRLAGGTVVSWTGPSTIRDHVIPTISKAAADAGRPQPRIAAVFSVCVTDDVERARDAVAEWFEFHGKAPSYEAMIEREGVASPSDIAIVGPEDEVRARIAELAEIGVDDFIAGEVAVPGSPDAERTRRLLASLAASAP